MRVAEAFVLLFSGMLIGLLATVFDVLAIGVASFTAHIALWVLLNALLASLLKSRMQACLWSIPFNLGYIEGYFLSTALTYEGFSRSTVVPLALVAVVSPLLVFALWTAKNEKNPFGYFLTTCLVVGTGVLSYLVNGAIHVYDVVMCVLLALVLQMLSVRRLSVTRRPLFDSKGRLASTLEARAEEAEELQQERPNKRRTRDRGRQVDAEREESREEGGKKSDRRAAAKPKKRRAPLFGRKRRVTEDQNTEQAAEAPKNVRRRRRGSVEDNQTEVDVVELSETPVEPEGIQAEEQDTPRTHRPTKRKRSSTASRVSQRKSSRERRAEEERDARAREERRRAAVQRRSRRAADEAAREQESLYGGPTTLGNSRVATRSTRSRGE